MFSQGCATSRAFTKRAAKLDEAGMTTEAASSYYTALWKNRYNVDAQIGMKKTGQIVLNQKLSEWSTSRLSNDRKTVVYDFLDVVKYRDKIAKVGVDLEIPEFYKQDFEKVKIAYLHDIYEEGTSLMEEEKYEEAERVFREISVLDDGFKDTSELKDIAYLEPLYAEGVRALELERFREAHEKFDLVMERKREYKDTRELDQMALDAGRFTLAVMPFDNATGKQGAETKAQAYVLQSLTGMGDPFLKVVDRADLDHILEEQRLGLTGVIDEETATEVGELLGADAILRGTVLSHTTQAGQKRTLTREGYESYRVKQYNRSTQKYFYETKYKPVTYQETTQRNSARVTYQYRVVSLKTGEILASDIIEKEVVSEAHFITYGGNIETLYPSSGSGVNRNGSDRNELRKLYSAPREVKTTSQLADEIYVEAGELMKFKMQTLIQEIIP
jgi:tetratricopeptide (TPR) repeat protein